MKKTCNNMSSTNDIQVMQNQLTAPESMKASPPSGLKRETVKYSVSSGSESSRMVRVRGMVVCPLSNVSC